MTWFPLLLGTLLLTAACGTTTYEYVDDEQPAEPASLGSCSCEVSINGDEKTMACGQSACVGGEPWRCGEQAELSQGGTGCDESSPTPTATPEPTTPNRATATEVECPGSGGSEKCDAATSFCLTSKYGGAMCAPFPKDCHDCSCASAAADASWRAKHDTGNCGYSTLGRALVSCSESNGAVSVFCSK